MLAGNAGALDFTRTPVLFVHGHGLEPSDWATFVDRFLDAGYPREFLHSVEIRPNRMANIPAAEKYLVPAGTKLLTAARAAMRKQGISSGFPERFDIVAHSMGAVSSRWYAAKLHPERVRRWISLAGANHGSNALCDHTDAGAADLCPAFATTARESKVQVELNGSPSQRRDETPFGLGKDNDKVRTQPPDSKRNVAYFTIRIEPDQWIKPERSAELDGAGGLSVEPPPERFRETSSGNFLYRGPRGLFTDEPDHCSILHDDEVVAFVERMLAAER